MKILLVDASQEFRTQLRERLRAVPNATVVGQAGHEDQAVLAAALSRPDVLLFDLHLAHGCGFSMLERLKQAGFEGTAYVVSDADEAEYGPRCVEAGVTGFYDKRHDMDLLIQALTVLSSAPVPFGRARIRANLLL